MATPKIFSVTYTASILPGVVSNCNFIVPARNQRYRLRFVTWNWTSRFLPSQQIINKHNNTTQEISLGIFANNFLPLAAFVETQAPTPAQNNGAVLDLYYPDVYGFTSFYAETDLIIGFVQANHDALNQVDYKTSIIIEIEEL